MRRVLELITLFVVMASARADLILEFESKFTAAGSTLSPFDEGVGVTGTALSRGTGLTAPAAPPPDLLMSTGFGTFPAAGGAVSADEFLIFGFTSTSAFDLTSLKVSYLKSPTGPDDLEVQIDTGGLGVFTTIFTDSSISTTPEIASIDLSSFPEFDGLTSATIRIVLFAGSGDPSGTFTLVNAVPTISGIPSGFGTILLEGTATAAAVPEPSSLVLIGVVASAVAYRRRRTSHVVR